ncbi:MAG TPA: carboxypeptidase-like regulatory domain-containing protein [Pyrinomonadaceae bacterium]|jgi:hypothetical protein
MKYRGWGNPFSILLIGIFAFVGCLHKVKAQGVCVREMLTVSSISGKVVSQFNSGEAPLYDIAVELLEDRRDKKRVIAKMTTGNDGVFNLRKIKPGSYILRVSYKGVLAPYDDRIRVVSSKGKESKSEIVVTLGADFNKPCGGTYAELRKKK